MAKTITTTVTDDLDGSANAKAVTFGLDGVAYSIDLSPRNEKKLRDALQEFINHAGRQRSKGSSKPASVRGERDFDISALRAWAAKKNIAVPARGRIPAAIIEQYKASGGR
jgi:hypothetical protein